MDRERIMPLQAQYTHMGCYKDPNKLNNIIIYSNKNRLKEMVEQRAFTRSNFNTYVSRDYNLYKSYDVNNMTEIASLGHIERCLMDIDITDEQVDAILPYLDKCFYLNIL